MIAAKPEVYLNTGHVSGPEVMRILDLAERFGIRQGADRAPGAPAA